MLAILIRKLLKVENLTKYHFEFSVTVTVWLFIHQNQHISVLQQKNSNDIIYLTCEHHTCVMITDVVLLLSLVVYLII